MKNLSSSDLNKTLETCVARIDTIENKVNEITTSINNSKEIIFYNNKILQDIVSKAAFKEPTNKTAVTFEKNAIYGDIEQYGITTLFKIIGDKRNLLNLIATENNDIYFNDKIDVYINKEEIANAQAKNIFKHDYLPDKEPFYYPLNDIGTQTRTVNITMKPHENAIKDGIFNTIEIDPLFPGAMILTKINIKQKNAFGKYDEGLNISYDIVENKGRSVIVLPYRCNLYEIDFVYEATYKDNNIFPFGFNHIYLYNSHIDNSSSCIAELNVSNPSKRITQVYDEIVIKSPLGNFETSITSQNIELYLDYDKDSNMLSNKVSPVFVNSSEEFVENVKKIYVKLPILKEDPLVEKPSFLRSLYKIEFSINEKNEI